VVRFFEQGRGSSFAGVVRGERDRPQWDLRSRCCYLPVALTKVRDPAESVQLLPSRALIRPRKAGFAKHDENYGTKSSNPLPSSGGVCKLSVPRGVAVIVSVAELETRPGLEDVAGPSTIAWFGSTPYPVS